MLQHFSSYARLPGINDSAKTITKPQDITPEWLTGVLANNGIDANVSAISVILSKKLPYSSVHRLSVEYGGGTKCPSSLFLKLGDDLENGRAEVDFYQSVAPRMTSPPLIRCYNAAFDEETGRSHILMDDLFKTHSQPPQKSAPSEELSRLAVEALAKVHRAWQNSSDIGRSIGKVFAQDWLQGFVNSLTEDVGEFLAVAGDGMPSKEKDAYRIMLDAAPDIWGRLTDRTGLTVTHGDMHWWNFLYPNEVRKHSVHVFDWHLWHIDLGARDLAFLLALGGFAEPRPEIEERLLRAYHDSLGVRDYSWDMLYDDYRRSTIRNLNIAIIFWKQGKHESTWRTAMRRALASCDRLRSFELIR